MLGSGPIGSGAIGGGPAKLPPLNEDQRKAERKAKERGK